MLDLVIEITPSPPRGNDMPLKDCIHLAQPATATPNPDLTNPGSTMPILDAYVEIQDGRMTGSPPSCDRPSRVLAQLIPW
jgi:hypothetical protein